MKQEHVEVPETNYDLDELETCFNDIISSQTKIDCNFENIPWDQFSVERLRLCGRDIKNKLLQVGKKEEDPRYKLLKSFQQYLETKERERPLDEQFSCGPGY